MTEIREILKAKGIKEIHLCPNHDETIIDAREWTLLKLEQAIALLEKIAHEIKYHVTDVTEERTN